MWDAISNWLSKRFASPLPLLFFVLGFALIIVEAIEIKLPNGTHILRANQFSLFILGLGVVSLIVAILLQVFDKNGPLERRSRELEEMEIKEYTTMRDLLHKYVGGPGGLDFGACIYNGKVYYDICGEQFAKRLIQFRVKRNLDKQVQDYLAFGKEINRLIDPISKRMVDLEQGVLFRVILDVEKGGFFYHHITDTCYVISATIDQAAMDNNLADLEMRSLVRAVENHIATLENQ